MHDGDSSTAKLERYVVWREATAESICRWQALLGNWIDLDLNSKEGTWRCVDCWKCVLAADRSSECTE